MFEKMFEKAVLSFLNDSSDKPRAEISRSYLLRPANLRFWRIELTIAFKYRESLSPMISRGCF